VSTSILHVTAPSPYLINLASVHLDLWFCSKRHFASQWISARSGDVIYDSSVCFKEIYVFPEIKWYILYHHSSIYPLSLSLSLSLSLNICIIKRCGYTDWATFHTLRINICLISLSPIAVVHVVYKFIEMIVFM
jgi:hypothetical protein